MSQGRHAVLTGRCICRGSRRDRRAAAALLFLSFALTTAPVVAGPSRAADVAPATPPAIRLDPARTLGSAQARVAIVEFADLRCPFCRRFHRSTLPDIKSRYIDTGKIRYCFRDRPRSDAPKEALAPAVAARCAGRQGAYWTMLTALFVRQGELGPALYATLAADLKLDRAAFRACVAGNDEVKRVRADARHADRLQIDATPTFFVGRLSGTQLLSPRQMVGAKPIQTFQTAIEELLRP